MTATHPETNGFHDTDKDENVIVTVRGKTSQAYGCERSSKTIEFHNKYDLLLSNSLVFSPIHDPP